MIAFTRDTPASRVVFGPGRLGAVEAEAARLGAERVLLVSSGSAAAAADSAAAALGSLVAGRWSQVRSHVTGELADRAGKECSRLGCDLIIAVGGGAATGLAKAVALRLDVPVLAVPTTYAGSEVTTMWGITEASAKTTGRSARVLPRTVIYDPLLTLSLPPDQSAASAMNAIAHCIEGLYAPGANPVASLLALEGIRRLAGALPVVVTSPDDLDARAEALYGAYLGGLVMNEAGTALHHKICHVLGGRYNLPHAMLHAILLPQAVACVEARTPDPLSPAAAILGDGTAAASLHDLALKIGAPTALSQLGMSLEDALAVAPLVAAEAAPQAGPFSVTDITSLLEDAFAGRRPT